ncbi:MAG TPA: alkaline phosphatase D family protein [Vitreimonas sp.]|nr:alkaline phosphatase D family protein [Vitreimonas sp.]
MSHHANRRTLLAQAAALGAALAFGRSCAHASAGQPRTERRDLYPQGVASGDPAPDSVILWTRRTPDEGVAEHRLMVEVASDEAFSHIVARGDVQVSAATDWTCRFLAAGLRPAREYWYRFVDEAGNMSRVGRTLTAPTASDDRPVRFAFVSCQDVTNGALNAYRRMIYEDARRPRAEQLCFVLHLGDFIYEIVRYPEDTPNGLDRGRKLTGAVRYPNGEKVRHFNFPTNLEDYRTSYRSYLLDPDLQDARARWPFVPVWDNHEFSWNGYQSQQKIFNDPPRNAQTLKVAASQAWYEYQPARVIKQSPGDVFVPPQVTNTAPSNIDSRGVAQEPNNLIAIHALQIERAFRFGKNIDMIITDNRSFMAAPIDGSNLPGLDFGALPELANDILDEGREYEGGAPAKLHIGATEVDNPQVHEPPQAYLGVEQMAWFKERLRAARAPWKIWGHSFGTLTWRTDPQNLPPEFAASWPSTEYGVFNRSYLVEHREIFSMIRDEGITGFAIVAGDKHSFWAGYPSENLPPRDFNPVGVEFITGSISQQGAAEVQALTFPKDSPLRPFYVHDRPDGSTQCAFNTMLLHGVRSALVLRDTDDPAKARAASNPENAPHLTFTDLGGYGYTTVRATPDQLETEFVCIPIPNERATTEDGGPLRYRVIHRVPLWAAGARPQMHPEVIEGDVELAI